MFPPTPALPAKLQPVRAAVATVLLGSFGSLGAALVPLTAEAEAAGEAYQQIRIPAPLSPDAVETVARERLELMARDEGGYTFLLPPGKAEDLEAAGLDYEVMVDDLEAFYRDRLVAERSARGEAARGDNFGIFHTYSEALVELQAIHAEFPEITTAPFSIGNSLEGRAIWALKVSDNPDVDENEPEVLFDGCHHSREIMTVEMLLDFPRYLCENYGTDAEVTQIVESREIWFIPVVNPDGFVYNELIAPQGGGMWRKNRRDNPGSCEGVDLNRNYDFEWVGSGSSTDPCDETFRGAAPESEPEIQVHTNFIDSRNFVIWQSYHSVAGMVLFPWGYTSSPTSENATYETMAAAMAAANGYQTGQPPEILYNVNGAAFDWGHGATADHDRVFSFTTEIDGSGFWPLESERDGLIAENLPANLYLCRAAGSWLGVAGLAVEDGGDGRLAPGESADLVVTVGNEGVVGPAPGVTVRLRCDDPYVLIEEAVSTVGAVPANGQGNGAADPFTVTLDPSCPSGRVLVFRLELSSADGFSAEETFEMPIGEEIAYYDFESGAQGWAIDPSQTATTGTFESIDPNPTSYQPGDDTTPAPGVRGWITAQNSSDGEADVDNGIAATRSPLLDLSGFDSVRLDLDWFFGQRDIGDDSGDFFRLSLSNNGGATFPVNLVSIGDVNSPAVWHHLSVVVDDYLPLTAQMVLRAQAADGTTNGDLIEAGLDEVRWRENGGVNAPPSAPSLVSPADGSTGQSTFPTLVVANAIDPEGDPLTYGFRVWSDPDLTNLVASVAGVAPGAGTTSWTVDVPLSQNQTYYWRAFAGDAGAFGPYMATASFEVGDPTSTPEPGFAGIGLSASPIPSAGDVSIRYAVPSGADAALAIFDAAGRAVRRLAVEGRSEGWRETVWDGRDDGGRLLPGGVYWLRLRLPAEERSLRLVRVP